MANSVFIFPGVALIDSSTLKLQQSSLSWPLGTTLVEEAANILALRNSTNTQALNIYNTFTDATHYENLRIFWSANVANIVTDFANGSARALAIGTVGANGLQIKTNNTLRWIFDSSGNLNANTDNSFDIGGSGANRPRTGYFGTSLVSPVLKTTTALITAVDGSLTAAFTANMVASTGGPTTAAQNGWVKMQDSAGATIWVPVWK